MRRSSRLRRHLRGLQAKTVQPQHTSRQHRKRRCGPTPSDALPAHHVDQMCSKDKWLLHVADTQRAGGGRAGARAPRCGKRWASQGRPRQVDRMAGQCETGVVCSQAQIRWRTGRLWLQQPRGRGAASGSRHKGEEALHTRPGARGAAGGVNQMPASRLCLSPPQACSPTGPRPLRRGAGAPRAAAGPGAAARHEWVQAGRWGGAGSGLALSSDWPSSVC